jgi:acetyl esterase/lipase
MFQVALRKAGVAAEMHLYVKGGHAFGLRPTESPITRWPQLLAMWLDDARHCFEGESENVGASLF